MRNVAASAFVVGVVALLPAHAGAQAPAPTAERQNIFTMAAGTVVLAHSNDYSSSTNWSAMGMFDGDPKTGWSSKENVPAPAEFVIETAQPYQFTSVAFDNRNVQEGSYAGIGARRVDVLVSSTGPDAGFMNAGSFEVPKIGRQEFPLASRPTGRWVKVVVTSNWGNAQYAELMEVEGYGTPAGARPATSMMTGAYQTNYGRVDLTLSGTAVAGCYYNGTASISGTSDGRVLHAEWRQPNGASATTFGGLLMAVSSKGDVLQGVWYARGVIQGVWSGTRIPNAKPDCRAADASLSGNLANGGRAILYGIRFQSDSATLDPSSEETLKQVEAVLRDKPTLKIAIEGHTDSTNTDAYNLDLSKRRANAVAAWLTQRGVAAGRLTAVGYGRTRPLADNGTPEGRALNRRVEIAAQ